MPWYVPSASSPSAQRDEHLRAHQRARTCEGAFGPSSSSWRQLQPSSTIFSSASSKSSSELGSMCSLIVTPRSCAGRRRARPRRRSRRRAARAHLVGDLDELRPPLGPEGDLPHGGYPTSGGRAVRRAIRARRVPRARPTASSQMLDEEYYLHFAGLKDELELEAIYERYADLTDARRAQSASGERVDGDRRVRELWRFACSGYLGNLVKAHEARAARARGDARRRPWTARRSRTGCSARRWRTSPTAPSGRRSRRRGASSARST